MKIIKTSNKKTGVLLAIVFIIVALGTFLLLYFMSSARVSSRYEKQITIAQRYYDDMDYEKAIVAFEEAIKINPNNGDAYLGLAAVYLDISEEGIDKYCDYIDEGKEDKASLIYEEICSSLEKASEALTDYKHAVGSKAPNKYTKKRDELNNQISDLVKQEIIKEEIGEEKIGEEDIDEIVDDNSPMAEEVYLDCDELNRIGSIYSRGWVTYDGDNIDYESLGVFLWWYAEIPSAFQDAGYSPQGASLRYISRDNAEEILKSIFYGDINLPPDLRNDDIYDWLAGGDEIYPFDDGYIFSYPAFGMEEDYYSVVCNIEKVAPYYYRVYYKEYYYDWEKSLPDGYSDNAYSYTYEQLTQYNCFVWRGGYTLDIVLTDEGYRIYKEVK